MATPINGLFTPKVQIIGCDIAGRVEAVGEDVKAFQPGDEVYGDLCMSGFGAFAEYAYAPETSLARKPPGMTIVTLKPNKDLAYMNELFEAGKLVPVIDGPYKLAEVREALRDRVRDQKSIGELNRASLRGG